MLEKYWTTIVFGSGGYDHGTSAGKGNWDISLTWNPFNYFEQGQSYAVLGYGLTNRLDIHGYYSGTQNGSNNYYGGLSYQFLDTKYLDLSTSIGLRAYKENNNLHLFLPQLLYTLRVSDRMSVGGSMVNIVDKKKPLLMDYINPKKITYLPNTAGCFNSKEALRTLRLAREIGGWKLVKLEVLGDKKTLFPDMIETLKSTEVLTKEGFKVMVYCTDDPLMAKRLENVGACAIMPLAAPIGSGLGIQNYTNIKIIRNQTKLPLIIDAGLGQASDATIAMELGCDGVLVNTAIAKAKNPFQMALAFKNSVVAGRQSYLSGRIGKFLFGTSSSPKEGII